MKKLFLIVGLGICLVTKSYSQTSNIDTNSLFTGVSIIANALGSSTNWAVLTGGGRSLTKQNNIAFADLAYSINNNIGLVVGYDYLWNSQHSQANSVKGGVNLQMTVHPFKFIGSTFMTNVIATPFVADLIASPSGSSSGSVANIIDTGFRVKLWQISNFDFGAEMHYENRSGDAEWSANYLMGSLSLHRSF